MINLLPYEDKKEVEREGLRRFLIVAVFSLSSVFLVCILLMMPVYIFSYQESLNLKREEDLLKQGTTAEKITEVTNEIKKINAELSIIESSAKSVSNLEIFKKILSLTPDGIKINSLSFAGQGVPGQGKMSLQGRAGTRESLLGFQKNLNDSDLFKKVDFPISNILKKNDIDFVINLDLK
ncbi:hypothetical protein A3I27_01315 [Candidatus Giovannonibacteria bacterium RIFCSPLOWO2_02_FULL_43_11b]|uniref:Fimbrial assembly protein n=1 Tax=Candidatus Giovannonibacteria bacterium RIFCSPHIGHO2_12_FULL_43_15 TaxID=1798341 RepID=A0A1F5WPC1_9BACT|nr:MAG: hypothetical protein A2739_02860 [Candidatus Giovannonibacteria bacterium RIFCSPHIGHO2_01_FULL_43_100]OGF66678.1 MAG: hypothetical protein A3B97_02055 [Candidatus Giovannonibacteria bacterium RIFCSPHIGHO2_02_FULL_43_32]OGF77454.1 MAG: hypothetical protein A3F23_00550 [Candidatus Giovannonibacteria bacterium RIFCSPHIGHO2_12_FULL_43_15]OGF78390.1 MAG: hypothetical protein A3A15_02500 [Candidatus Giovannonibacteria bacterium RIFCSPLOWO2_01_FULL_43_60]OGF90251.1 MAG: hypothetical protein A3